MGKRKPARIVVESRAEREGTYQLELVKCGKEKCRRCRRAPAHGPYWYFYQWQPGTKAKRAGGRLRSTYIGKVFARRTG